MRCELSGYGGPLPPLVLNLVNIVPFLKEEYVDLGYTNYDVMCIGGAGGDGGGADAQIFITELETFRIFGGAGGGGGLHRVQGLLSALPASCEVYVGSVGNDGYTVDNEEFVDEVLSTPGTDGGRSSFNGTTCQASGGKGGMESYPTDNTRYGKGGDGGLGNTIVAGGGGDGGVGGYSAFVGAAPTFVHGEDGGWDGSIGGGGGGGGGGYIWGTGSGVASKGGRGSYTVNTNLVYGPGGDTSNYTHGPYTEKIIPGEGGGATVIPITTQRLVYGSRIARAIRNGVVVIRLTQV
jgi:hypothetical protein